MFKEFQKSIPARMNADLINKIRSIARKDIPVKDIHWETYVKNRHDLFAMESPYDKETYCGWCRIDGMPVRIEKIDTSSLWTLRHTPGWEEIVYYNKPDENGCLIPYESGVPFRKEPPCFNYMKQSEIYLSFSSYFCYNNSM